MPFFSLCCFPSLFLFSYLALFVAPRRTRFFFWSTQNVISFPLRALVWKEAGLSSSCIICSLILSFCFVLLSLSFCSVTVDRVDARRTNRRYNTHTGVSIRYRTLIFFYIISNPRSYQIALEERDKGFTLFSQRASHVRKKWISHMQDRRDDGLYCITYI